MDINGANLKQLTNSRGAFRHSISDDGRWVVYENYSTLRSTVWKVSMDGGDMAQLSGNDKAAFDPIISPDGKQLSYVVLNERNPPALNIIPLEGGAVRKTIDFPSSMGEEYVWTPDTRAVIYINNIGGSVLSYIGGVSNVLKRPLDGGSPTQLTDFKSGRIWSIALSRDGKQLAMSRGEANSDVVLISNFR